MSDLDLFGRDDIDIDGQTSSQISPENTTELTEPEGEDIYKNHSLRLLSFVNWPNGNISREQLALAGFYYVGGVRGETGDTVRCAWCGVEINNWQPGQCPVAEHLRNFPDCEFIKEATHESSITLSQSYNSDLLRQNNIDELGICSHTPPVHPKFATYTSRVETFRQWPAGHSQKPKDLATAGFYYTGPNDQVRCFHCDIGLGLWESTDNPWVEHAKYFPGCSFLILIKGKDFAQMCRENNNVSSTAMASLESTPSCPRCVTASDVEACMTSPCVIFALQCGLQAERIRAVIRKRLQQTGTSYVAPMNLISAALNEQIKETPFNIPESFPPFESTSTNPLFHNMYLQGANDAVVNQVTRMITNSDLMGENAESRNLNSSIITDITNLEDADEVAADGDTADEKSETGSPANDQENSNNAEGNQNAAAAENIDDVPSSRELTLQKENKRLRDARTCKICLDSEVSVVFLPCGHLVSCTLCATGLLQCPVCRARVKGIVRTYLS